MKVTKPYHIIRGNMLFIHTNMIKSNSPVSHRPSKVDVVKTKCPIV